MRRFLLMLMIPAFFAFSANAGNVKVKVKIGNPYGKAINVIVDGKTYTINMDAQGVGSVDVDLKGETMATFSYPRVISMGIYLIEGKDLEVSFDLQKKGADLAVVCDDKGINDYLLKAMMNQTFTRNDFTLEEDAVLNKFNTTLDAKLKELKSKPFSKKFKESYKNTLMYSTAGFLSKYVAYHPMATKKENYEPSAKFYSKIESLAKENSKLASNEAYKAFVKGAIEIISTKGKKVNTQAEQATLASKYAAKLKTKSLREYLIFNYTNDVVSRGTDGTEELVDIFKANVKDAEKVKIIDGHVAKWSAVAKGKPSPKFNLKDINGKMVSLDDLKGKYVYIDCWATWCGPCCGEIPHLKKLEHDYHGKNIHFVSISCDRNKGAWEAKVKKEQLGGIQLILGKDRSFMDAYMVTGIPRFILIDKEGNIYNANAPRPSSPAIRDIFNSLKGL